MFNIKKDREGLAKMIVLGCLPFSFAASSYLVTYIQRIYNPLFKGIPRSTCSLGFLDNIRHIYVICSPVFLVEFLLLLILVVL